MHIMHTMKMKIRVRPHLSIFSARTLRRCGRQAESNESLSETDENIQYSAKIPTIQ